MGTKEKNFIKLVKRASSGDQLAFQEIYNLKWKEVHFVAWEMLSDFSRAQDVAQDVFMKVYYSIGQLKTPETFNAWLYKILRNTITDLYRKKSESMYNSMDDIDEYSQELEEESEEFLPQDFLERSESRKILSDVVQSLNEDYRIVVLLYYYEQMSHKEIAQAVDSTTPAVAVKLMRARKFMKSKIEQLMQKGVVLYSMPAVPIMTIAFRNMADQVVAETVKFASWNHISATIAAGTSPYAAGAAVGTAAAVKITVIQKAALAILATATCTGAAIVATIGKDPLGEPAGSSSVIARQLGVGNAVSGFPDIGQAESNDDGTPIPETMSTDSLESIPSQDEVSSDFSLESSSEPPITTSAPAAASSSPASQSASSQTVTSEMQYPDYTLEGILGYDNAQDFLRYLQSATYETHELFITKTSQYGLPKGKAWFENFFDERLKRDHYMLYSKEKANYILYISEYIKESDQTYDILYRIQPRGDSAPDWDEWAFKNR